MGDDSENTVKWLIALAIGVVTVVLTWLVMRRIGEWVPSGGGDL